MTKLTPDRMYKTSETIELLGVSNTKFLALTKLNPDRLYKTSEARELLGVGNTKLWALIAAGELDCRKMGRLAMITGASLAALIERLPRYQPKAAA